MLDSYVVYIAAPILTFVAYFILPYLTSPLNKYPGPRAASLTRLWLAHTARYGVRSVTVHEEHLKHGKFVRIGPNEGQSFSDPPFPRRVEDRRQLIRVPVSCSLHRGPGCLAHCLRPWKWQHQERLLCVPRRFRVLFSR